MATRWPRSGCGRSGGPQAVVMCSWFSPSGNATARSISGRSAPATCTKRRSTRMKKKIPDFRTDEEAENFVDTADLSEYDLSAARPVRFEFDRKEARVN